MNRLFFFLVVTSSLLLGASVDADSPSISPYADNKFSTSQKKIKLNQFTESEVHSSTRNVQFRCGRSSILMAARDHIRSSGHVDELTDGSGVKTIVRESSRTCIHFLRFINVNPFGNGCPDLWALPCIQCGGIRLRFFYDSFYAYSMIVTRRYVLWNYVNIIFTINFGTFLHEDRIL